MTGGRKTFEAPIRLGQVGSMSSNINGYLAAEPDSNGQEIE